MEEQKQDIKKNPWREIAEPFIGLARAPRALWGIYLPYVLEGLVYFGILTILGKFNSENVGLSDLVAGWVYGAVTGGITFAMLLLGGVSDKIGVRRSIALALFTMMLGRLLISISGTANLGTGVTSPMFIIMSVGLFLMVAAYGLYQPAAYAGVKRFTNPKTAAMGYAVVYGLMNLGAFFSGFVSPIVRHNFIDHFPPNGLTAVFWVYTVITGIAVLATITILTKRTDEKAVQRIAHETAEMNADNEKDEKEETETPKKKVNNLPFLGYLVLAILSVILIVMVKTGKVVLPKYSEFIPLVITGILAIWEFLRNRPKHPFRDSRFVFFIFVLIPVQTLFAHNWLTLPYYLDRAFAGTIVGNYFEFFSNLNPILIFFLAPIIAALTLKSDIYKMMILGTFIMAVPTFLLAIGPNMYLLLTYILLMTIGEAMWQPRFLQWIAEIAPKGRTGAYMGIGQLPWFLTKMITAAYSGYFIANYVPRPETGLAMRTGQMWLVYGLIAIITPISLILAKKWMGKGLEKNRS
ncbi:MAG: MFS transporter [Candidatus Marinimicrobia bacterium]|nr:MFS transporter [bacterium]MCG2716128.1 MFS transporter [Candidatus Neomarinimicrobiota bacterium]